VHLFVATLVITVICCLLMGLGLLLGGKPLEGGCGKAPTGMPRCVGCPNRGRRHEPSGCPNEGET
jgi:hypothetical protein